MAWFKSLFSSSSSTTDQGVVIPNKKGLIPDLANKPIFITGCDSGFGHRLALTLNAMGVPVYAGVLSEKSEGAEALGAHGCKIVKIDITKEKDVEKAVKFVAKDLGEKKLHALMNNAGIAEVGQVEWCDISVYSKVLQVNTLGTVRVTQAFLPLIRSTKGSRIVFTASVAGRYTLPGFSAYSMSKHALISFADALRKEMKPFKVSVHTIQPTAYTTALCSAETIDSSMQKKWDGVDQEIKESYGESYFQAFKAMYLKGVNEFSRKNINEVVEEMIHALLGKNPKITYIPTSSIKFRVNLLTMISTASQDKILCKRAIPSNVFPASLTNKIDV
ncbi:short-chain dehydrogenase/reductase family 9C member 7-like [Neocloeon triangulifer]|uniref:short-chain dehydrogenase/reductase family 9C member 7-like n=1 Tax=Neocloeon triangulifer TaxID=2078957 RepID=UPI00286EE3FC|nr:short-chain dehydrogenase/reductase family 9C member 7-like [Neocloeon triangulifer]